MEEKTISNSRRCYKQWLWFMVLFMSFSVIYVDAVWPMPQMISSSMARYTLNPREFIFQYSSGSSAQPGCSLLDSAFERYFPLIFTDYRAARPRQHDEWFRFPFTVVVHVERAECEGYPDADSSESYKLSVCSGQAALRAETVWGALRGLESFSQLVYQDDFGEYFVNETKIEDFPRFQFRGILLDTSRHYLPLHAILKTLDAMSYNKFNVFHWHIVDDPSFPYQSSTFPDLSSKGAFHPSTHVYTQIDVKRVIAHARLRGIRVLAEFDSPGHTQSWGKGQPGLLTPCYKGTVPSGTFGPVNPANSSSYQFMTRLFKEVTSVFPDSYVHLGGDEVDFTCWKSNPDVRGFMLKMGFGTDYTKLESYYMENMVNITKGLNKTAIVWQDVFDYHEKIPVDTVLHIWKGSPGQIQQELSSITLAGYRVILAAPWYINHIDYGQDWEKYYTIQPLNFTGTEQQKKLVIGGEVCMWGEYVDATNLSPRLWPRASAAGERLWSDERMTSSVIDAFPRLVDFRCRLLRRGIQAEPLFVGHCRHEYQGI
ncbi:beta-hexosaminidase subunit alpha isoform X1 [Oncorhynchus mykiss]|uniref:Beta-hexosaminidase n=1 Tax=Oncorhynchus mykiss TaxID=8022 RepID=A0A8C7SWW7_ONCMY|nr:beta-hexosaminidase subunit alpha isoform X1 [Oncorhynchus mykiss]